MIDQQEVRRIAGALMVDPRVVDHDYVMGCFLHHLAMHSEVRNFWIFKGGSSLAKCYFNEYRFSEDLGFTVLNPVAEATLINLLESTQRSIHESMGIRTDILETKIDRIIDDHGKESIEIRIYY